MTVNAQDFLESIQRAAGQKPKKKKHKMLTAAPDLSVFGIPDGRSGRLGQPGKMRFFLCRMPKL